MTTTLRSASAERRVVLSNVSWSTFLALVRETDSGRGRFTYDRGVLEILSPSGMHERIANLIDRLIGLLTLRLGIEVASYGSTTLLRESKRRGLEPDKCYYVQNEPKIRGKGDIDLKTDPPPDLVVEVDLSSDSLDKFEISSALGVTEIWRHANGELRIHRLRPNGKYVERARSSVFPDLPLNVLRDFISRWDTAGETTLLREFEAWAEAVARKR